MCWQPDPKGQNLRLLARALRGYVRQYHADRGLYAVFLDFCSLHQKGAHGEARTASEAALEVLANDPTQFPLAHSAE